MVITDCHQKAAFPRQRNWVVPRNERPAGGCSIGQ
jgi:hypothetical protein